MDYKQTIKKISSIALLLSFFTLTFCTQDEEVVHFSNEGMLTKDAEVINLMLQAAGIDESSLTKVSTNSETCTDFRYPITFYLNVELPEPIVINNDQEFTDFVNSINSDQYFYIYFPIILLDLDGEQTIIYSLEELEGSLKYAIDACESITDPGNTDDNSGDDSGDDSSDDSNNDGSDDSGDDSSDDNGSNDNGDDSGDDSSDDSNNDESGDNGSDDSGDDSSDDNGSNDDGDDSDDNSNDDGSDDSGDDSSNDDNGSNGDDNGDDGSNNNNDDSGDDNGSEDDGDDDQYQECHKNGKKVAICHNGHTICVSVNAIWGHMNQHEDDYLGECSN